MQRCILLPSTRYHAKAQELACVKPPCDLALAIPHWSGKSAGTKLELCTSITVLPEMSRLHTHGGAWTRSGLHLGSCSETDSHVGLQSEEEVGCAAVALVHVYPGRCRLTSWTQYLGYSSTWRTPPSSCPARTPNGNTTTACPVGSCSCVDQVCLEGDCPDA